MKSVQLFRYIALPFVGFLFLLFGADALAETGSFRIVWHENPSSSALIGWDVVSGKNQEIHYGNVDHGTNTKAYHYSRKIETKAVDYKGMHTQFVKLVGLEANTAYYFIVSDNEGVSKRFWFKTAPDRKTDRLAFIAGGDSRNHRAQRKSANMLVAKLRPHAVLFGGDMTSHNTTEEWKEWFTDWQLTIGEDGRIIPIIPARGNHELSGETIAKLFGIPEHVYYAMNFCNNLLRIYTLNSEINIGGTQSKWLEKDLVSAYASRWKIVQYHRSIRPHVKRKPEGLLQYLHWAPLFYNYGMNLAIESDAHCAKVTWPIRPDASSLRGEGFVRDDLLGTIYAGEGGWGAPLREVDDDKPWTRAAASLNQIKWIFVDKSRIEMRTLIVGDEESSEAVDQSEGQDVVFVVPKGLRVWMLPGSETVVIERKDDFRPVASLVSIGRKNKDTEKPQVHSFRTFTSKDKNRASFSLSFYCTGKERFDITIFDSRGRALTSVHRSSVPGNNLFKLKAMDAMNTGIYFMQIKYAGATQIEKLILK